MLAVAYGLTWKPGDEVLTAVSEFPLQYTTWKPMEQRENIALKIISPRDRFLTADDFIAALTPQTRLVSVSLVRFDNGVLLDAARLAAACRAQGALLLLDVSQCCGAIPLDVNQLGADFMVSAGYKWLLGPFGTGFFWAKSEHISKMRPGPFYWMAAEGAENFAALNFADPKPAQAARRWDAAETANYYNRGNRRRAQSQINRSAFLAPAAGSLCSRHPPRSQTTRPVWLFPGAYAGKNQGVLRQTTQGKCHYQFARRKNSRLALHVQQ